MSAPTSPLPFWELIETLKTTKRGGWIRQELQTRTESVSDHMYRMAVMCHMAPGFGETVRAQAAAMALVHDMGEAIIGDITPYDGISPDEKRLREELAVKFLSCTVRPSNPHFADMVLELWNEYEAGKTQVSQLVRQIDKLECMNQAAIYEERSGQDMEEFMALRSCVTLPELQPWLSVVLQDYEELKSRRKSDTIIVFVSGGPGVGKGTQCTLIAEEFGFCHISVGDLLRKEAASPLSHYGAFITESMQNSVLLPAQLTTYLLRQEMQKAQAQGAQRFLLDGFPRSVDQAASFGIKISDRYSTISLDCSEETMRERLEQRAQSSERIDDNSDVVLRRFRTYEENNAPVLEYLREHGPVHHVDAARSVDAVHQSMRQMIEQVLKSGQTHRVQQPNSSAPAGPA
ncbi:hypothetical protein CKM354_001125700 [Cercospora kikuchii]|uniref:HD domain-containing protein n=1 Tax=Cercospora kikuchii TaxID=84275 RepID=A0A9P3CSM7_9PEZI|nr:uncharacterized protein CKM354_001125700 [Cercospora kikuchii]GIZ48184.1 hypothetical protein CKM354_001125700 [Cercospora kikuchii]